MSPKKKKSLFYYCFPCIKHTDEDPDELLVKNFGTEFTEYEYVIENLAIRRAPKILFDQHQPPPILKQKHQTIPKIKHTQTKKPKVKDFGAVVERESVAYDVVGPVVKLDASGDADECCPRGAPKCIDKIKDDVLKKILIPPCHVFRVEHPTPKIQKVSAEVHKCSDGSMLRRQSMPIRQSIPSEIKQTIEALKVAKPPVTSTLSKKNRRQLVRSVSDTSCDKETFCNFLDPEIKQHDNKKDIRSSLLDVFPNPNKRKSISKFQQGRNSLPVSKLAEPGVQHGKCNLVLVVNKTDDQVGATPKEMGKVKAVDPRKWTAKNMQKAVEDVINKKMGVNEASRLYEIPSRTLRRHILKGWRSKQRIGRPSELGYENELKLVAHIKKLESIGFPLEPSRLQSIAYDFAENLRLPHRFNNEKKSAGWDWFQGFMKRHPDLSERKAEGLSLARASGMNRQ
ncbi:uncharacterized protein LOC130904268 [Diorhabda carinulata]|uniref:uncharacterized protein LOC130904268 n=1 Tax=Diorhabda carinulata TaxID=1163345 RepID=UPI0025A0CB16|nr:uncharacterized protein LOC130904268 [Diorhabda carinulata]